MTADEQNEETTAEQSSVETRSYEVEFSVEGSAWVTVDATDEDEAHDAAREVFYEQNNCGDIDVDRIVVEAVRETHA